MKGFLLFLFAVLWVFALYYGYVTFLKKSMKTKPDVSNTQSLKLRKQQTRQAQDTLDRQRRLSEQRQRRLRNNN